MDVGGVTPNHMLLFPHRALMSIPSSSSSFMSMSMSSPSSSSSLLTQSEHHAFNAFLSSMAVTDVDAGSIPGAGDVTAEWQMYSQLGLPIPLSDGSDALSKATKDLIALHPPPRFSTPQQPQQQPQNHRPIAPTPGPSNPYFLPSTLRNTAQHPVHHSPPSDSRPNPSKRPRTTPDCPTASTSSPPPPPHAPKTTLLSAQQKKANHIQSEQKRRANIRRGYEALCETVPALQEAIRAEDEENGSTGPGAGGSGVGRKKRTKGEDGEKVDGRAGPRSESVVLQKSMLYF